MAKSNRSPEASLLRLALTVAGAAAFLGALLHLAIAVGGPDWYARFGAPPGLVELARQGHWRAPVSCLVIAAILTVFGLYAFSAAGRIRRLRLLVPVLGLTGLVLSLRGMLFIPLILWQPQVLARFCDCRQVDSFIVWTSVLCLSMGLVYLAGAWSVFRADRVNAQAHGGHRG